MTRQFPPETLSFPQTVPRSNIILELREAWWLYELMLCYGSRSGCLDEDLVYCYCDLVIQDQQDVVCFLPSKEESASIHSFATKSAYFLRGHLISNSLQSNSTLHSLSSLFPSSPIHSLCSSNFLILGEYTARSLYPSNKGRVFASCSRPKTDRRIYSIFLADFA